MAKVREFGGYLANLEKLADELKVKAITNEVVIEAAYNEWGLDFPNKLNGNFYIIIDDADKVLMIRDRFGARSLYYYVTADGKLLCSTSIREMIKKEGFVKEFNADALELFLSFSYLPGKDTFFKGMTKVRPGEIVVWENGKLEIKKYWEAEVKQNNDISIEEMGKQIHFSLMEARKDWQRDAKVRGNFLSGGVDSGYLTALMEPKLAVSACYDDPAFDESAMAQETADTLKVKMHRFKVTPEEYFKSVPLAMEALEEPLGDASSVVFYMVAGEAKKHVDVCYSGEGADELFCGYHAYVRRIKQIEDAKAAGVDLKTLPQVEDYYIGNTRVFHEDDKKKVLKNYAGNILPLDLARSLYKITDDMDDVTKILLCDLNVWFEGDIMLNAEKMSLAHNLDCRTPFLDKRVVDVALTIPSKYRASTEQTKLAFRTAASHLLPESIAWRKKIGFAAPTRAWMCEEPYVSDIKKVLSNDTAKKFFNTEEVLNMYEPENIDNCWRKIWCIYVFLVWYERYFG